MELQPVQLRPVGLVHNQVEDVYLHDYEEVESEIVVSQELEEGLEGIEEYSHLEVFYYFHRLEEEQITLRRHPKDRKDLPVVGIFAIRTQLRPTPIGASVVQLLGRRGNVLRVRGLDAVNGSPVLDIKPYTPRLQVPEEELIVPAWLRMLGKEHHHG